MTGIRAQQSAFAGIPRRCLSLDQVTSTPKTSTRVSQDHPRSSASSNVHIKIIVQRPARISDSFHHVQDYSSYHRCRQRSFRCRDYSCNVLYSNGEKSSSCSFKHYNLHNINNFCTSSRSSKQFSSTSLDCCSCRPCGSLSIRLSWPSCRPCDAIGPDLFIRSTVTEPFVGRRAYHSRLATARRRRSQEFKLRRRPFNTREVPRKAKGLFPLRL